MPVEDRNSVEQPIGDLAIENPAKLIAKEPYFSSRYGAAYLGDSLEVLRTLPSGCVNLVVTSPPYALHFKKEYGNETKEQYVEWFLPFAREIFRVLAQDGSFVLNIGGSYNKGTPTRSLYHFRLLLALVDEIGFFLAQECFWHNPAKMPVPAEWVTVRRIRVRDSVEYVWWFSKTPHPKASNLKVLRDYSADMIRLNKRNLRETTRPSGHVIRESFTKLHPGGAIPSNVVESGWDLESPESMMKMGNNSANDQYTLRCKAEGIKIHPARFPSALPKFFIKMLTEPNDLVFDPFGGSLTTGAVAEKLERRWIAGEAVEEYLKAGTFRFEISEENPKLF
ncbi:site-specific DNA-methyltransferase [Tunturibacter empetritectus]|uniref:Methyltransferase n=1 Tax=Tunturiibacter empetritectus TaxID=3069691 RepID=A0AAU7ZB53_9BACT